MSTRAFGANLMRTCVICASVFVIASVVVCAQVQQATLDLTVHDASGLPVPGAAIDLRSAATNRHRTAITGAAGRVLVPNIGPGVYALRVEIDGFAPFEQADVVFAVGQILAKSVTLNPAGVSQSVTVSAAEGPVDAARTSVSTVIDAERIEELPVRSRNYLEFVLLAPGVARAPSPAAGTAAATGIAGSGFSFAGLRPRSNTLTIDGLDNNDAFSGGSRTELSLETVREFQVVTSGWSAESGGASGGSINVVTKTGANILHGDAFTFGQSGRLDARPKLEDAAGAGKPRLTRVRAGFAIGGPIRADRTFYYAGAEQEEARGETTSALTGAKAINSFLAGGGLPLLNTRDVTDERFATSAAETELSGTVTQHVGAGHTITGRIAGTNRRDAGNAVGGAIADRSARGTVATADTAASGSWLFAARRFTNDLRLQTATRRLTRSPEDSGTLGVVVAGDAAFGPPYFVDRGHRQRLSELADTVAIARARHLVKFGADVLDVRATSHWTGQAVLIFPTVRDLLARQPAEYRRIAPPASNSTSSTHMGAFIQDHWTPAATFSVDAGVRIDLQSIRPGFGVSNQGWGPRAGFAWSPAGAWVVRGGFGLFPDRLVMAIFDRAGALNGARGYEQITSGAVAARVAAASTTSILSSVLASLPRSTYTVQSGNWRSSSAQTSIGVERGLSSNLSAGISYLFVRGVHLPRTTIASATVFETAPSASSTYHGVTATVNRRLANEFEWTASYTYSRAIDTASDFDESPQDPVDPAAERARSRYDQPHRLVINGLFDLPIGDEEDRQPGTSFPWWVRALSNIELAPIITIASGYPVDPVVGYDVSGVHPFPPPDRPPGYARNSLRLPSSATVDMRLVKSFSVQPHGKLDLVIEGFNLLNRTNVTELSAVFGGGAAARPAFGRPIAAAAARQLQASIDFEF